MKAGGLGSLESDPAASHCVIEYKLLNISESQFFHLYVLGNEGNLVRVRLMVPLKYLGQLVFEKCLPLPRRRLCIYLSLCTRSLEQCGCSKPNCSMDIGEGLVSAVESVSLMIHRPVTLEQIIQYMFKKKKVV